MVFLVAEIGVNWDGDFKLAREMMEKAKEVGFDAVKFQAYNKEIIKDHPKVNRLINCSISSENIDEINNIAKSLGIEWFCTPMYPDAVDLISPFVKKFKVRVADSKSFLFGEPNELCKKILDTQKEIIISSESSPKNSKFFGQERIKWLYCVPKYPCGIDDLDFTKLSFFNGYSNHYPNIIAPITAVILGSKIIEVHVTSDKSKNYIDNPVSFDYMEQKVLVESIRLAEKIKK